MEKEVSKKVKEIIADLKLKHAKFEDNDFGPTEEDEHGQKHIYLIIIYILITYICSGALALYGPGGPPPPAGHSKYPSPDLFRWDRPQYADEKFHDGGGSEDGDAGEDGEEEEEEDDEFSARGSSEKVNCHFYCFKLIILAK